MSNPNITTEAIIELAETIDKALGGEVYGGRLLDYVAIIAEQQKRIADALEKIAEQQNNKGV